MRKLACGQLPQQAAASTIAFTFTNAALIVGAAQVARGHSGLGNGSVPPGRDTNPGSVALDVCVVLCYHRGAGRARAIQSSDR